jgi:ribosome-binding protein aMBF1 (putative translation factor)
MPSYDDLSRRVAEEAAAEGSHAVDELRAFEDFYRLARQLAERRLALNMTQGDLARKASLQQSEISRIEQGRANPTYSTLRRVVSALDAELTLSAWSTGPSPRER